MITYFNADISYDTHYRVNAMPTYFLKIGGDSDISNDKIVEISTCVMKLLTALKNIPEKERENLPGYDKT